MKLLTDINLEDALEVLKIITSDFYSGAPSKRFILQNYQNRNMVRLCSIADSDKWDDEKTDTTIDFCAQIDTIEIYREQRQLTLEKYYKCIRFLSNRGYRLKWLPQMGQNNL